MKGMIVKRNRFQEWSKRIDGQVRLAHFVRLEMDNVPWYDEQMHGKRIKENRLDFRFLFETAAYLYINVDIDIDMYW